jgi:hypothetical protein
MQSPFPGMDPFLELSAFFPGLHDDMVTYLKASLQDRLPERYYAVGSDRLWVEVTERTIEPDVQVRRSDREGPRGDTPIATAVAEPRTKPIVVTVPHDERREPYLEIFTREGDRERLVTTIEVLSLSNKTPGEHGRELYRRKQREVLDSKVHLVEIDLLRGGEHTTAVRRDRMLRKVGPVDYHVSVHRFDNLEDYFIYPILLDERLPEIAIPLLPGDSDVVVDLQSVFDRCYETGRYRRRVRYGELSLNPPLSAEKMEWVRTRLREQSLL